MDQPTQDAGPPTSPEKLLAIGMYGETVGVTALSVAVLISGFLQFVVQWPLLWRFRLYVRPAWDVGHAGLRLIVRRILPVAAGVAVFQINVLVDRLIAEFCVPGDGAVSALHYGNRLMQFPLGVLGLALATAVLPEFSRRAAEGDREGLTGTVNLAIRSAIFMALPCMAAFFVLNAPMVRVLFERGRFDAVSTARAARVLFYYAMGLWAFCSVHVLARAFYALQDMRTPVRVATLMVGLNLVLNLILVWPMKEAGLALASSISSSGNAILLVVLLRRRAGPLGGRAVGLCAARTLLAAALSGLAAYGAHGYATRLLADFAQRHGAFLAEVMSLGAGLVAAGGVFLVAAWVSGSSELREFIAAALRRRSGGDDV